MMTNDLYEQLRKERNELAQKTGVQPFMVLHNKVLRELAQRQPTTVEELGAIKGMGSKRVTKYGQWILNAINGSISSSISVTPEEKIYSVSEFIDFINELLAPKRAVVQGEVNQIKPMGSYTFFTLLDKDGDAALNCFVWQSKLDSFGIELKEGLELKVEGFPKIYKRGGRFNFEVEHIGLVGKGVVKQAFEILKKKLAAEGYFELKRKKPIPAYAHKIGLITSAHGDAINDFLTHLGKFGLRVCFYDVRVEGLYAVEEVTSAIRWYNENMGDIEVLVLTRGGGSLESLQPFNSEAVAKAIFGSRIPIISGVGHENDVTIADLVADVRASTPTHAARILSDPWQGSEVFLTNAQRNILSVITKTIEDLNGKVLRLEETILWAQTAMLGRYFQKTETLQTVLGLQFQKLISQIKQAQSRFISNYGRLQDIWFRYKNAVDSQGKMLTNENTRWLRFWGENIKSMEQKLQLASPELRLKQGYSIIQDEKHTIIKNSRQVRVGDLLTLKFHQGGALSTVKSIKN